MKFLINHTFVSSSAPEVLTLLLFLTLPAAITATEICKYVTAAEQFSRLKIISVVHPETSTTSIIDRLYQQGLQLNQGRRNGLARTNSAVSNRHNI